MVKQLEHLHQVKTNTRHLEQPLMQAEGRLFLDCVDLDQHSPLRRGNQYI